MSADVNVEVQLAQISDAIDRLTAAITEATAPPATDVMAVAAEPPPPLSTWGYLELMGHRIIVGFVEEDELAGRRMLRVRHLRRADRQPGVGEPKPPLELEERWRVYSLGAVYSFEPLSEAEARERHLSRYGGIVHPADNDEIPF